MNMKKQLENTLLNFWKNNFYKKQTTMYNIFISNNLDCDQENLDDLVGKYKKSYFTKEYDLEDIELSSPEDLIDSVYLYNWIENKS